MPPRKRRQSAQGDDIAKESGEKQTVSTSLGPDSTKQVRGTLKGTDLSSNPTDKRLARQSVKQETLEESATVDKGKDALTPPPSVSEPTTSARQATRFSTRIVKRPRRDLSPPESPVKKGKKNVVTAPETVVSTTPETKGKRQWELWSVEDKDSFFEGLCEYGKDFESIHNLIVTKCKKKSTSMPITVKNKEQVRHFYYRTWHKISKIIQPVKDLKKDIQELYGLISYSVLRKKLRGGVNPNDKNWQKLNDLVHQGVATIKVKGKRIRVKTPVCAALKKLNLYEEPKREPGPKVPEKIHLEFRAKTNTAWQHVQDLAHNPRVRVTVRPDRHLQSLVKYLDQKWKLERLKKKERLDVTEVTKHKFRVYPCRTSALRNVNLEAVEEPVLQFCLNKHCKDASNSPSAGKKKKDGTINRTVATTVSGNDINTEMSKSVIKDSCQCFDTCTTCLFRDTNNLSAAVDLLRTNPSQKSSQTCLCLCNKEPQCRKMLNTPETSCGTTEVDLSAISLFGSAVLDSPSCKKGSEDNFCKDIYKSETVSDTCSKVSDKQRTSVMAARRCSANEVSAIADGENAMFPDSLGEICQHEKDQDVVENIKIEIGSPGGSLKSPCSENMETEVQQENGVILSSGGMSKSSHNEFRETFKNMLEIGWNCNEGTNLTFAELYLMFGANGELKFEYDWVNLKKEAESLQEKLLMNLNNMLRRLSHLATMEITDFSKTTGASSTCSVCGHNPAAKQKSKTRSPTGKSQKSGKDVSTQTTILPPNTVPLIPGSLPTTSQNGVFRIPVLPASTPSIQLKPVQTTTGTTVFTKEMLQRYNPSNLTTQKQFMRRKLKPMSRRGGGGAASLVQRTILPKNSEYIAIIPMVPGTQIPNNPPAVNPEITQTIVGHPINGIQTQPISIVPTSPSITCTSTLPKPQFPSASQVFSSPESMAGSTSLSLSPSGDETLLRIPESHLGTMSPRSLKAAGMSTIREANTSMPISVITTPISTFTTIPNHLATSTPMGTSKTSLSPPTNTSSLLDISLLSGDLSFSCLLDDSNSKTLTLDQGLVTPPIRTVMEQESRATALLHSPPVRSLFTPTPDQQWLNGDVPDLSLSSFLESPSKPSTTTGSSMFTVNMPLSLFNDNSRDFHSHKLEVDSTLQSMMTESSIDYVKKFADLAEQIAQNDNQSSKPDSILKQKTTD